MKPLASARGLLWDSFGLFSASLLPFELQFEVLWMALRLSELLFGIAGSVRRALGDKSVHMCVGFSWKMERRTQRK